MRKEYDFSKGVRGVHAGRYREGVRVVVTEEPADTLHKSADRQKDTQLVELAGRHLVIAQLTAGGVEVAIPVRDKGIDLIAYVDTGDTMQRFVACPLQLKVASGRRFGLDKKYAKVKNLLLTYVWNIDEPEKSQVYAMTYTQALTILIAKGYDKSSSWKDGGSYSVSVPDKRLMELLEPYHMNAKAWAQRVAAVAEEVALKTA